MATTTATTSATTSATAATTTTATAATLVGFVDSDGAPVELVPVHALHRRLRGLCIAHRDETEAARATRFAIHDDLGLSHDTKLGERSAQPLVVRVPAKAAYKKLVSHS